MIDDFYEPELDTAKHYQDSDPCPKCKHLCSAILVFVITHLLAWVAILTTKILVQEHWKSTV